MDELFYSSNKWRIFIDSIVILFVLVMLLVMMSLFRSGDNGYVQAESAQHGAAYIPADNYDYGNPNIVTSGLSALSSSLGQFAHTAEQRLVHGTKNAREAIAQGSKSVVSAVANASAVTLRATGKAASTVVSGAGSIVLFVLQIPVKTVHFITNAPGINSVIAPAQNSEVPVIDSQLAQLYATHDVLSSKSSGKAPANNSKALWPLRGDITTQFGVPHQPYQVTHTGIDISSGNAAGVTAIKPFKPGKVVDVIYSGFGLGNHLVIDHGNGISSVYGHLSSISVKPGQRVDSGTVLGSEGSTGASTGPHLHFEIRLNGQPVNPRDYMSSNQ